MALVLSETNEVYPIGFIISAGIEDVETCWTKMLNYLKEACPIIFEQGFNECDDEEIQHPFLFISDRDEGLKLSL